MTPPIESPFVRASATGLPRSAGSGETVAPKTLSDEAYRRIRQDIIAGTIVPGAALRIEQLKADYGIGASPLREALSRLSSQGLATMEGQRGFRAAALSLADLEDVTRLRIMFETQALRESIDVGDDRWEARIVGAHHQLAKIDAQVDFENYERWNREFHDALIGACSSRLLLHFRDELYDHHRRYRCISSSHTVHPRDVAAEHRTILDAALARDAEAAASLTADHIQRTADLVGAVLGQRSLTQPGRERHSDKRRRSRQRNTCRDGDSDAYLSHQTR